MEDILAVLVVLAFVGVFIFTLNKLISWKEKKNKEELERQQKIRDQVEAVRKKFTPSVTPKGYVNKVDKAEPVKAPAPTPTYSTTTSTRSSTSSSDDDSFLTGMVVGALLDNAFSHKTEERSVGVSSRESSWGFDDSDSRKSISDSMDTSSWSSSSSSSDSWSSSDSGPSSDW